MENTQHQTPMDRPKNEIYRWVKNVWRSSKPRHRPFGDPIS